jgi:H+/gluconate symporter-like permease
MFPLDTLDTSSVLTDILRFANNQPIVWPSIALAAGSLLALALFPPVRGQALTVLGNGTQEAIMPLINTAAVIGFGGVVTHTEGFSQFTSIMLDSALPPLFSVVASVSLVSAITGSGSGGLQIFMQTMAPAYLEMGIEPETLHRMATMASGGFDSLPHCGAVVAMLTITQLSHREAYRDVGIITVVIPVASILLLMGVLALMN